MKRIQRHGSLASYWLILPALFLTGCGSQPSNEEKILPPIQTAASLNRPKVSNNGSSQVSTSPQAVDIEGVTFTIPTGWKRADLMPAQAGIIAARYLIPVDGGELQLTFTKVRGGIEANFARWTQQMELDNDPIEDRITLSEGDAFWIDLRGTYRAGGAGFSSPDPETNTRMLGIGIPIGNEELYLKLLGPTDQVAQIADDIRKLVKSADLP